MSKRPAFMLLLSCAAAALLSFSAHAIVIRHDTGYARHTARESQFPAVFYLEQRRQRKICVATLIHPQWALTAAHCIEETSLGAALAAGEAYPVTIAGQDSFIDQAVRHPNYPVGGVSTAGEVDLALLRLSKARVIPRPLPLYQQDDEQDKVVTLLGWGFFGIGTRGIQLDDGKFRMARNTIETAASRLRFVFDDPRESAAALDMEGVPGLGDSGGPALLEGGSGWELAGIAVGELERSDERQGRYGAVAIYERVSLHLDWIQSTIADHAPAASD